MRVLLIAFAAVALPWFSSCTRTPIRGVTVDPAFRTLIPPDTSTLSGMEWDALKASPFYQRHQHDLNIPAFNEAVERVGINPLRDLSKLLVASNATDYLFMERGRFNADDLQKRIASGGARETTYRGHKLLGNATGAMVFFKSVALEGDDAAVRRAIDLESAGEGEVPEELAERLRTLDKRDQIWTVSRAGLAYANLPMKADLSSALANITGSISGTTAGIYVDSGFHLSIELQCKSDAGATRVHDALRGLIGFGRLSTRDNEKDLLRAYDSIQVDKSDQTVKVRTDLTGDVADKLLDSVLALKHSR